MTTKTMLVPVAVLLAVAVHAKTVAWYHFDEGADGTSPAGGEPVILNAVDPSTLPGRAWQVTGSGSSKSATGDYLPTYRDAFPKGLTWTDPVTGAIGANGRALQLADSDSGSYKGAASMVVVDNDAALRCANVTVEFMLKTEDGLPAKWRDIVLLRNGSGDRVAWGFYGASEGAIRLVGYPLDGGKSFDVTSASKTLFDGKWHHVAFTYDGATVKLYVDYGIEKTAELTGGLEYADNGNGALCLGANNNETWGRWSGCVDELRISDKALEPAEFLHPATLATGAVVASDPDVVFYNSFDACFITDSYLYGTKNVLFFRNEATPVVAPKVMAYLAAAGQNPESTLSVPAEKLHAGVLATESKSDPGAWYVGSNGTGKSFSVQIDDTSMNGGTHLITGGDFTFETFFRAPVVDNAFYLLTEGDTLAIRFNASGELICDLVSTEGASQALKKSGMADDAWHHLALVSDRTAATVTLYVDKIQVAQATSFVLKSVAGMFQLGGGWGLEKGREFKNIYLDEMRITRRALLAQEFLFRGEAQKLSATRVFIDFEGDYNVGPEGSAAPMGKASSASVVFSDRIPGTGYLDQDGKTVCANTKSVEFTDKGCVNFKRNLLLETDMQEQTVEFFVRIPSDVTGHTWANVLGLFKNPSSDEPVWMIGVESKNGELYMQARNATEASDQCLRFNREFGAAACVGGGRWHHVAFTFAKSGDDTAVTCYRDYEQVGTLTFEGFLDFSSANTVLMSGLMPGNWGAFKGNLDGVRITKGALSPDQMLKLEKRGLSIIIR